MINSLILVPEITKGMKSIGSKSLLKIKEYSILEYQINQILGINNTIKINIATGFDHEKIKEYIDSRYKNINWIYNENYENTNQTKCLSLFLEQIACEDLLIINSGILFKNKSITYSSLKGNNKIYLLNKPKLNFSIGCSDIQNIEYLFYDLPNLWAECVYFNTSTTKVLKDILLYNKKHMDKLYLFEIINDLIQHNIGFDNMIIDKKNIFKINNTKDIPQARRFI
jgi:hypothetical protein